MSNQPDPALIFDYIEAFRRSKTMFTAVRLGVFDQLESEPQSAASLATKLNLHAVALSRLLDACVALALLLRDGDTYRNAATSSRYLVSSSPHTLAGYIVYSDESLFALWSHLADAVREGTNRWSQAFGRRDALFDYYFRDPVATANFISAMNGFGQISSERIVKGFDLSRFTHLVDLGGATGHLAIAACVAYQNLRATVLDLPRIEELARAHIAQSKVADRVQFATGDFFTGPLPPGDLYALGRILHDWPDSQTMPLLERIFAALPANGGVLIAEALVNDDRSGPVYALMQDLNMLVCTEGKERTFSEYVALLQEAGFVDVQSCRSGSLVDGLLARKK